VPLSLLAGVLFAVRLFAVQSLLMALAPVLSAWAALALTRLRILTR